MSRPLALDLFCGAGGATRGLQLAGFHVTGIDIKRQPRYCGDAFIRADALRPPVRLEDFDFIWASPPCQRYSTATVSRGYREGHPDLVPPVRDMLAGHRAWCIENVPGAPLRPDLVLTGEMFGLATYRRRHFELSFFCLAPRWGAPFGPQSTPDTYTVTGHPGSTLRVTRDGRRITRGLANDWRRAMGIDWMTAAELTQAIPPAYSEFIGRAALAQMQRAAA